MALVTAAVSPCAGRIVSTSNGRFAPLRYKALYLRAVVVRNGVAMRSNDRDGPAQEAREAAAAKSEDDAHAHGSNEKQDQRRLAGWRVAAG